MPGHRQHQAHGQVVFVQDQRGEVGPAAEREVARGNPAVRLGQAHLGVVQQDGEQRPLPVGSARCPQPAVAARGRREAAAQAEPAGQVHPGLRPREDPGDSPQVIESGTGGRAASAGRPGTDPHRADLRERADPGEPGGEPVGLHQRAVGAQRAGLHPVRERPEPSFGTRRHGTGPRGRGSGRGGREQHRGRDLLQVPLRDHRVPVSGEDHLTLLGDLEPPGDRAGRLREHRPPGRSAAAPERAAAAVEERQPDVPVGCPPGQPPLRVEQPQRRADRAEFLGRVGIAEHDLQAPAGGGKSCRYRRKLQHVVQHPGGVRQVSPALEERDDVEHRRGLVKNGSASQLVDGRYVGS